VATRAVNPNKRILEIALFTPYRPGIATLSQFFRLPGHEEIASIILACRNEATFGNHSGKKKETPAVNLSPTPCFLTPHPGLKRSTHPCPPQAGCIEVHP
jgi:hypothetical protein